MDKNGGEVKKRDFARENSLNEKEGDLCRLLRGGVRTVYKVAGLKLIGVLGVECSTLGSDEDVWRGFSGQTPSGGIG